MSKVAASVPPSMYVNVLPSGSVAATATPIFVSAIVFSATARVVVSPSVNTGARFGIVSSMSVMLIVTLIVSVRLPSETVIVSV